MHPTHPHLAVFDLTEAVLEVGAACPDALDLCTEQLDSCFKALLHEVVVMCLAVLCRDLDALLFRGGSLPFNSIVKGVLRSRTRTPSRRALALLGRCERSLCSLARCFCGGKAAAKTDPIKVRSSNHVQYNTVLFFGQ